MLPQLGVERVVEIDGRDDARWEAFVRSHPDGCLFHHPLWLRVLEAEYGRRGVCLGYEAADGRLEGILPLLETSGLPFKRQSPLVGHRLSSLPRTPLAGPLVRTQAAFTALMNEAQRRAGALDQATLEIKASSTLCRNVPDSISMMPWRLSYVLPLPEDAADLHFGNSRNHARIKWAVNKAVKEGVLVRAAESESDLRRWYPLYLETMRTHVVPARSFRFFRNCWELLGPKGCMRLLLAEWRNNGRWETIAGSVFFMFGKTVFYSFNGRSRKRLSLRPNDAIQWQAIHDACAQGFRAFDFGEVIDGQLGLAEFKGKWGAQPEQLYRFYYPTPPKASSGDAPDRMNALAGFVWRRLPLSMTAVAGDWVYRRL